MIGIFDSGSGGLTVLREIRNLLPSTDILYFGDIKNAPYGMKTHAELTKHTIDAILLLESRGATSLVSACNSVSAALAVSLIDSSSSAQRTLIEMVGPTVAAFRNTPARILLTATPATIESGIYQNAFRMLGKKIDIIAIPALAEAIEFGAPSEKIERIVSEAFATVRAEDFDVLILGCTHYPLVAEAFRKIFGNTLAIFDPAGAVADRVERVLWPREAGDGKLTFLISRDSEPFRALVSRLFPNEKFSIEVVN